MPCSGASVSANSDVPRGTSLPFDLAARRDYPPLVSRFDLIVVGGGHAGCEAAAVAARMGARTALVSFDLSAWPPPTTMMSNRLTRGG